MKIKIRVHSRSSQEKIQKRGNLDYEVWLREEPKDNRANLELLKILKRHFKSKGVRIKSGFRLKNKVIEIID